MNHRFNASELGAISPDMLRLYAESVGWKKIGEYGDYSDIYGANDKPKILIARTNDLVDYTDNVSKLIRFFAEDAKKHPLTIFRDLLYAIYDVTRIRVTYEADNALLTRAANLISSTKDLIVSASRSLVESKPVYTGGKFPDVVNKVRFGPTETGSLIVILLMPIPQEQQGLHKESPDPPERRLTLRVMEALEAVRIAIDQAADTDCQPFKHTIENGVSSNLCEALAEMTKPFPTLTIATTWAKTRPTETTQSKVNFNQSDSKILENAKEFLKQEISTPNTPLTGTVTRLQRDKDKTAGTVTLKADYQNKKDVSVTARLEEADYETMIRAHRTKSPVTLRGTLQQTGKWALLDAQIIHIGKPANQGTLMAKSAR